MSHFLDTSALLKRYIPEDGTAAVDAIFAEGPPYISSLSLVEAVSVFRRLLEVKAVIKERDFQDLKARLFADIDAGSVAVVPLTMEEIIAGVEMVSERRMTPMDALILAVAAGLRRSVPDLTFVTSDRKLGKLAEALLPVLNPAGQAL